MTPTVTWKWTIGRTFFKRKNFDSACEATISVWVNHRATRENEHL
jgi:hypothetical protein